MNYPPRYAVLLDGGFVIQKLKQRHHRFPSADDVVELCEQLKGHSALAALDLLRIYFYHAPPAKDEITNPLSGETTRLADTDIYAQNESLIDSLEMKPDFALRMGETVVYDWKLGKKAMGAILEKPRPVEGKDLVPNISQKGVDLRIGLDIARLALRQMVQVLVVVTGDSDLIPAFKFARREGVRVYLLHMNHGVRRDLKAHTDLIL